MQFTKLFSSILDSTIWQEPVETKILWITMLAMVDRSGEVHSSIPGLARRAGITLDQCEQSLLCLLAPDKYSRTPDFEGRRVAVINGGWELLNHAKYRALLSAEERKEYQRLKQQTYRSRRKQQDAPSCPLHEGDKSSNLHITESESEGESEGEAPKNPPLPPKGESEWIADPIQIRLNALYSRRDATPWDAKMLKAYAAIDFDEDEIKLVETFHSDPESYKRKGLPTLLNNWGEEVDRARMHRPAKNQPVARTASRNQPASMFQNPNK